MDKEIKMGQQADQLLELQKKAKLLFYDGPDAP